MKKIVHIPVMMDEVLTYLRPKPGERIIDGTVGQGGSAAMIIPRLLPDGRYLGIDRDPKSVSVVRNRLAQFGGNAIIARGSYRDLKKIAYAHDITSADGIFLDLGFSSAQIDAPERGFSFQKQGPLDMRFNQKQDLTAAKIVNSYGVSELERIFRQYADERNARAIAKAIVQAREEQEIGTTTKLADVVASVHPRKGKIHPATKVFQALRIAVNDELAELENSLEDMVDMLNKGGRLVIISFHSLEDRIVKKFFKKSQGESLKILTKRAVKPKTEEIKRNPRARSAVLRAAERL